MSADSRLLQLIGAGPEQLRVRERLRQFTWKRETMLEAGNDPGYFVLRMTLDELPAFVAWRAQRNRPVTAPPGWLPKDPHARHLVVHGTPPPRG